jgi:hypothetical protein
VVSGCKKLFIAHVREELKQWVVEAAGVEKSDRLEVQTKLKPSENFDDLFKSADASGQRHKSIGELGHSVFAFVHGLNGDKLCEAVMSPLLGNHGTGNNSDDLAASGKSGVGENPHETDTATAINNTEAASGAGRPE